MGPSGEGLQDQSKSDLAGVSVADAHCLCRNFGGDDNVGRLYHSSMVSTTTGGVHSKSYVWPVVTAREFI